MIPHTQSPTHNRVWSSLTRSTARDGLESVSKRLHGVQKWLAADLGDLAEELEKLLQAASAPRPDDRAWLAAGHLLRRPGKRVRPICVLLAARLGETALDRRVHDLALAAELVHAATLLHDDVIDEGTERRGVETSRLVFGNSASILAGDQLFVEALRRVMASGTPELLRGMLEVIARMVAAEALQLELRGRFEPDRELYLEVAHGKTTSLFRWALLAGGTLAGLEAGQLEALSEAAIALGLAFQLVDDLLDLSGDPALTGKDLFADVCQGKLTWPLIVASERDPDLRAELRRVAEREGELPSETVRALLARVRATGALEATRARVDEQGAQALGALTRLPESSARTALETVVRAVVARVR